jgi:hypothetical protein
MQSSFQREAIKNKQLPHRTRDGAGKCTIVEEVVFASQTALRLRPKLNKPDEGARAVSLVHVYLVYVYVDIYLSSIYLSSAWAQPPDRLGAESSAAKRTGSSGGLGGDRLF